MHYRKEQAIDRVAKSNVLSFLIRVFQIGKGDRKRIAECR